MMTSNAMIHETEIYMYYSAQMYCEDQCMGTLDLLWGHD